MAPYLNLCTIATTLKSNWSLWWNKDKYPWLNLNPLRARVKKKPLVEPRRAKQKTKHQAPTQLWKLYEEAVIESEARTTAVQLKNEA